jgi:hypothetical protein
MKFEGNLHGRGTHVKFINNTTELTLDLHCDIVEK